MTSAATAELVLAARANPVSSIAGSKISPTTAAALVIKPLRSIVATHHLVVPFISARRVVIGMSRCNATNEPYSQTRHGGFPARRDCLRSEAPPSPLPPLSRPPPA